MIQIKKLAGLTFAPIGVTFASAAQAAVLTYPSAAPCNKACIKTFQL